MSSTIFGLLIENEEAQRLHFSSFWGKWSVADRTMCCPTALRWTYQTVICLWSSRPACRSNSSSASSNFFSRSWVYSNIFRFLKHLDTERPIRPTFAHSGRLSSLRTKHCVLFVEEFWLPFLFWRAKCRSSFLLEGCKTFLTSVVSVCCCVTRILLLVLRMRFKNQWPF